jgi:hypothetical protein
VTQPLHTSQLIKNLGNTSTAYKPRHKHTHTHPWNTRSQGKTQVAISDTAIHRPQHAKRGGGQNTNIKYTQTPNGTHHHQNPTDINYFVAKWKWRAKTAATCKILLFLKVKVKLSLYFFLTEHHVMKAIWGSGDIAPRTLTSALDAGEWSALRPGRFIPRERAPGTHWKGGWVGPRAVLDAVVKRKFPAPAADKTL